jgi:hypothetical protein
MLLEMSGLIGKLEAVWIGALIKWLIFERSIPFKEGGTAFNLILETSAGPIGLPLSPERKGD